MKHDLPLSRRAMLGGLLATVAVPGCAEAPKRSIRPEGRPVVAAQASTSTSNAQPFVEAAKLGGATGFIVAEVASGKVLEASDADLGLPPASVAKALTALYGFDRLGASHRFSTQVIGTGSFAGGRLNGDLVLVGSGDPTLDTDRLGDLAASLAKKGLREVTGQYLAFAGGIPKIDEIDREQPDFVGYNPAISGLNLNFNRVNFEWRRGNGGYQMGFDARGKRFVPKVGMARMKTAARETPLFTYSSGPDRDDWTVAASALGKAGSRWLPVRHPEIYTAEVFATLLAAHGIRLRPPQVTRKLPAGVVLTQTSSQPLTEVMRDMLKFSTNITAEVVGLSASGAGSLAASGAAMSAWARGRFGVGAQLVDHSGLGGSSRVTARDMMQTLRAGRSSGLPAILRDHGLRDGQGKGIKGHPVRVVAKTGTLNFASGLAGYIQPPSGRELVFAIFSADVPRRDRLAESQREAPEGGSAWVKRARGLQNQLVARWAGL